MSRRDTIIIAVLINAGLMVMLFVSALKKDSKDLNVAQAKPAYEIAKPVEKFQKQEVVKAPKASPQEIPKARPVEKKSQEKPQPALTQEVKAVAKKPKEKPPASQQQVTYVTHIVKKGDVLEKIAKNYQTSVEEIVSTNRLSSTTLQIGQELKLPKSSKSRKNTTQSKPVDTESYYIVKNGDNLWKIAIEHHLRVEDLLRLNDLNEKKAKALRPGDRLRIR
jgi:peptidoglycan DL-endopeptidase LytF